MAKKAPFAAAGLIGAILEFLSAFSPTELNQGEERAIAQMKAYFDPPKTLDELRSPPQENALGYERHHIVGRNPDNIEKVDIAKFGIDRLEQPDNIVWIPRLKHEEISADYNSRDEKDPQGRRTRVVVGEKDFDGQMEAGLEKMREKGILK